MIPSGSPKRPALQTTALQKKAVIGNFDLKKGAMEDDDDTDGGSEDAQPLGSDGSDGKPNSKNYEDQVHRLTACNLFDFHKPKMPWEKAPFHDVFGKPKPLIAMPQLQQCFVGLQDVAQHLAPRAPDVAPPTWVGVYANKRRRVQEAAVSPDDLRCKSLLLLKTMIESGGTRSEIGRQLRQAVLDGKFDKGWTIIEDSFGAKKTGTLYKHARALWNFFVWSKQWQAATEFQWTDDLVYDYLCFARSHNKAPTHGMALLQAFNFLNGVSALDGYTGFSARVKGLAKILFANKRTLVQARQLKKCEVAALEDFVLGNAENHLRFIAGYCLFCLMASCRHSDPMFAISWCISRSGRIVLLEAGTRYHKTSGTGTRSTMLLPLVALGHVFRQDRSWAEEWMILKKDVHKQDSPYVLPSWSERVGAWLSRPMAASEACLWLKEIMQIQTGQGDDLSTHSLKCTLLAWTTMTGVLSLEQRRTLGPHVDPAAKSALTYGRENMIKLQATVAALLIRVASGDFNPDAPRAALVEAELQQFLLDLEDKQFPMPADVPEDVAESLVEEDADFNAEVMDVQASLCDAAPTVYLEADKVAGRAMQHLISGVIHVLGPESKFLCGRPVSKAYCHLESGVTLQWPLCRQCECTAGIDFVSELQS